MILFYATVEFTGKHSGLIEKKEFIFQNEQARRDFVSDVDASGFAVSVRNGEMFTDGSTANIALIRAINLPAR